MIRHMITESGNHMVGPSVVGVHRDAADASRHFESIRRNFQRDGYTVADNYLGCFTVNRGEETCTFALQAIQFD
jgi:hypothetical protein